MVDLRAADPSLGVRGAADLVAAQLGGTPTTHAERLRKKYYALERTGELPTPKGVSRADQIRQAYAERRAMIEGAREELSILVQELEALGFDLPIHFNAKYLSDLLGELDQKEHGIGLLTVLPPSWTVSSFVEQGITGPDEAVDRYNALLAERHKLRQAMQLLEKMRPLKYVADLPLNG